MVAIFLKANNRTAVTTNTFQSNYAWGHSDLIEYITEKAKSCRVCCTTGPGMYGAGKIR